MLLISLPWAGRVWALPFLTPLCPSKRYYEGYGRAHRPLTERARQVLRLVQRWLPRRSIVVADSSFAVLELLAAVTSETLSVVTRLRLDAALYEPAPTRVAGRRGRPRKKGKRLPTLSPVAAYPETEWQRLNVALWYGEANRIVELVSGTAVWYHKGKPPVALRWVLIRDPPSSASTPRRCCVPLPMPRRRILCTGLFATGRSRSPLKRRERIWVSRAPYSLKKRHQREPKWSQARHFL